MVILDSMLFWTVVSAIAAVVAAFVAVLTIWMNRQKKKEKKLEALEKLKQVRNELCVAMNNGEINMLLNNAIAICDEKKSDSKSLIEVQNQLQAIVREVNDKWNCLKIKLASSGNDKLLEQLDAVMQEYLYCFRDVETIVSMLGCKEGSKIVNNVSLENSVEMRSIIEATKPLFADVYEFVNQVISLRFKDLDIPDYATKICQLWDDERKIPFNTNTRLLAAMGNPMAQCTLGDYYYEQKQFKKAFVWYKKSAEQGFAEAQYNLGQCYSVVECLEKDEKKAFEWYKKSAEQNLAEAQYYLGVCYDNGIGIEKDEKEAVKWYKKSAEQGYAMAQYYLGVCYDNGIGVKRDKREAVIWYKKSAKQGYAMAQYNLGVCYDNGIGVKRDEKEAVKWYKKSAEQGYAMAQYDLGVCYDNGNGVEKDEKKAFEWVKRSAEQGESKAQFFLGIRLLLGIGVESDIEEAFFWYKKSAEQGRGEAQLVLGGFNILGLGCVQNYNDAYYWFNRASEHKEDILIYRTAMFAIGMMYEYGLIGFGSDFVAVDYYKIAAQYGSYVAQYRLGYCYEKGIGVKDISIEEANYWYGKAAEQKNEDSIKDHDLLKMLTSGSNIIDILKDENSWNDRNLQSLRKILLKIYSFSVVV